MRVKVSLALADMTKEYLFVCDCVRGGILDHFKFSAFKSSFVFMQIEFSIFEQTPPVTVVYGLVNN